MTTKLGSFWFAFKANKHKYSWMPPGFCKKKTPEPPQQKKKKGGKKNGALGPRRRPPPPPPRLAAWPTSAPWLAWRLGERVAPPARDGPACLSRLPSEYFGFGERVVVGWSLAGSGSKKTPIQPIRTKKNNLALVQIRGVAPTAGCPTFPTWVQFAFCETQIQALFRMCPSNKANS